jgi:hypothetical protein
VLRWIVFLLLSVLLGCDQQRVETPPIEQPVAKPEVARQVLGYRVDELSAIGAYLPELDEGRLQVAPPVDWRLAPRSNDYVARFVFDRQSLLPMITVRVQEAEQENPGTLTRENVVSYVAALDASIDERLRSSLKEPIEPLMLGDVPCARYVQAKAFRRGERIIKASREVIETIRDGRVYSVELDAHVATLVEYRADAYAVMANMKFPLAK